MEGHENAKDAKRALQQYKSRIVAEVNEESRELMRQALEQVGGTRIFNTKLMSPFCLQQKGVLEFPGNAVTFGQGWTLPERNNYCYEKELLVVRVSKAALASQLKLCLCPHDLPEGGCC